MKSKKLFAILTLVAFMMTLVPALAFAERDQEPFYPGDGRDLNRTASSFSIDTETVDANGEDTAKISVFVYDNQYDYGVGVPVYFASSRGNSDMFITADGDKKINAVTGKIGDIENIWVPKSEGDRVWSVLTDNTGKAEIKVSSRISGRATIGAALFNLGGDNTVYQYLVGNNNAKKDEIGFIDSEQIEFTAESASKIKVHEVKVRNRRDAKNVTATEIDEGIYKGNDWNRANDLDYYEVSVRVTNNQGAPSADQQVTFSSNKTNCRLSDTRVYTDGSGIAKTKVYAKKAGTYEISFRAGSSGSKSIRLVFEPAEISKIILKSDDNRLLAKDDTHSWKFELQDSLGNRIDVKADMGSLDSLIESIDAVDYPSNGDFKTSDWVPEADADNDWLKIKSNKPFTKEGSYRYRITLKNGDYAEFKFEIREQGEYTGLKLKYDQTSLAMKTKSGSPTVTWVDANGVEKDADDGNFANDGISFSASDYNKILDGKISAEDGTFVATDDSDYIGDVIITAFDSSNKLSASFKISIGRELCGIEVEEPADNIEVGTKAYVPIKFVDIEGNQVAFGDATVVEIEDAYALSKPAGAIVSVDEGPAFAKGLKEEGAATLEVESDKAGEAEIFVNVKTTSTLVKRDGGLLDNVDRYYTTTFKVTFGEPKQIAEGAAQKVVMFIGSQGYTQDGEAKLTDVAPFIKDNRTFVAVRPVADAFGVTPENIGWNEATQTVTLVRDDMTVTIVIGSNDIEIVKDGVVSTVEADVPAFIADGRTVLPFRAVGDAFGVTTNWDEATQSVTYEQ